MAMLVWAAFEAGLMRAITMQVSPVTRAFFAQPTVKSAMAGLLIGRWGFRLGIYD